MPNDLLFAAIGFARRGLRTGLPIIALVVSLGAGHSAASYDAPGSGRASAPILDSLTPRVRVDMKGAAASADVRLVADWIMRDNRHRGHPFIVADKARGLLFAFDANGGLLAKTPALFGAMRGDALTAEQAGKTLAEMAGSDKITPAGVFAAKAYRSVNYGEAVRFAEYAHSYLLIHRAFNQQRVNRLQSPDAGDHRFTYGCINVLPEFVDNTLIPAFSGDSTVVVLPETQSAASFFAIDGAAERMPQTKNMAGGESFISGFLRRAGEYTPRAESERRDPVRTPRKPGDGKILNLAAPGDTKRGRFELTLRT